MVEHRALSQVVDRALRFLGMICGLTLAVINGPIALDGIVGAF